MRVTLIAQLVRVTEASLAIASEANDKAVQNTLGHASACSALGRIRTCDTRFRKPMLYPLSYEG